MTRSADGTPVRRLNSVRTIVAASAFALVQVVLTVVLLPVLTPLAVLAPVGYAAVAGVLSFPQLLAGRFLRAPGAILLTAVFAGSLASAFSPLGLLVVAAFAFPALAVELVLWASGYRWASRAVWVAACCSGGLAAGAASLVVVDSSLIGTSLITLLLAARVLAAAVLAPLVTSAERMLRDAGVRP